VIFDLAIADYFRKCIVSVTFDMKRLTVANFLLR